MVAYPKSAKVWPETMDPYDRTDYQIDLTPTLEDGEEITTFEVTPYEGSTALGLTVGSGPQAPTLLGNSITVWLEIDAEFQNNAAFTKGVKLPLEISFETNLDRRKQRTVVVHVIQR